MDQALYRQEAKSEQAGAFDRFMALNRQMLDCYATVEVNDYRGLNIAEQRDVCLSERRQMPQMLIDNKLSAASFIAAAKRDLL